MTPRGFIDAASTALPVRVRLTSSQSRPITRQQTTAVKISFCGVRTPKMLDHALDDRQHGLGVVGEEIGDQLLDHDAPQQGAGEDEDLLLLVGDPRRFLDRLHHREIGGEGRDQRRRDADQRAGIGVQMQHAGGGPGRHRRQHHDGAVRQVEHAGDAEDQGEAGGAERVQGADGKAVDQDLESKHL